MPFEKDNNLLNLKQIHVLTCYESQYLEQLFKIEYTW